MTRAVTHPDSPCCARCASRAPPQALEAAYLFYEAQRSGQLPPSNRVAWRSSAHTTDLVPGGWCEWLGVYRKVSHATRLRILLPCYNCTAAVCCCCQC